MASQRDWASECQNCGLPGTRKCGACTPAVRYCCRDCRLAKNWFTVLCFAFLHQTLAVIFVYILAYGDQQYIREFMEVCSVHFLFTSTYLCLDSLVRSPKSKQMLLTLYWCHLVHVSAEVSGMIGPCMARIVVTPHSWFAYLTYKCFELIGIFSNTAFCLTTCFSIVLHAFVNAFDNFI